jgi:glycosyltransferase involved in cell wall biosynthesis
MVGNPTDLPTAYMLADVVVVPSIVPEGFGRVPVEAQAMGRPVVVSNSGGLRETMLEGETGWLVRVNDPQDLAEAINAALDLTPAQRHVLAARAIQNVHAHFSKDEMCWATLDVYQELYGKPVAWQQEKAAG